MISFISLRCKRNYINLQILNFSFSRLYMWRYSEKEQIEESSPRSKKTCSLHARPTWTVQVAAASSRIRFVIRPRPFCLLPFPSLSPYLYHRFTDNHYYSSSLPFIIFYYVSGMRHRAVCRCFRLRFIVGIVERRSARKKKEPIGEEETRERKRSLAKDLRDFDRPKLLQRTCDNTCRRNFWMPNRCVPSI